jgi:G3E family GTPase
MTAAPLPTTVLGGFLGAGKTTLVNRILRDPQGRRIAVMVNDFGSVSIDRDLIESSDGPVLSLANGCVCCSMGGDFARALNAVLSARPRMDHLLIEASGVSDPGRVADIARADPELSLDAVVTLVDAAQVEAQYADHRLRDLVLTQLRGADLLLLNKADVAAGPSRVERWLHDLAPATPVFITRHADAPVELILGDSGRTRRKGNGTTPFGANDHETMFARWAIGSERILTRHQVNAFLSSLPPDVLRLKGWVSLNDGTMLRVQKVGPRCDLGRIPASANLAPTTQLTAIGLSGTLDLAQLDRLFMAC